MQWSELEKAIYNSTNGGGAFCTEIFSNNFAQVIALHSLNIEWFLVDKENGEMESTGIKTIGWFLEQQKGQIA